MHALRIEPFESIFVKARSPTSTGWFSASFNSRKIPFEYVRSLVYEEAIQKSGLTPHLPYISGLFAWGLVHSLSTRNRSIRT